MDDSATPLEALSHSERVESVLATVRHVLSGMGIVDVTPDSVVAAPRFYDGPVLIPDTANLNRFIGQLALSLGFAGYAVNDVALLTVTQLCELFLGDSYREPPNVPLSDDQYEVVGDEQSERAEPSAKGFPICFVLGCGRSGTTLFRTMLNPPYSDSLRGLERIGRQFPNARFVHLVRRPHDVVRSLVRMQLYKGAKKRFAPGLDAYQVGEATWFLNNANIEQLLRDVPSNRKCQVRYEDLVFNAEEPLTRVCNLLERPYDTAMANPYANREGRVARGAGDMRVNFLDSVENRKPTGAFYPLGARCRSLAEQYGY